MPRLGKCPGAAFCLVCMSPLVEPFQDSEVLINRNVSLVETFCEYLEVEGDCAVVSKEFPFCGLCKISLIELKALHAEVLAMFTRIYSIKLKLTAKILESKNARINAVNNFCTSKSKSVGSSVNSGTDSDIESHPEISANQSVNFSKSTYEYVTKWRNSIFGRYDVSVTIKPPAESVPGIGPIGSSISLYKAVSDPECSNSNTGSGNCGDGEGMDNFSANEAEVSDIEFEVEETIDLNRELTPPINDCDNAVCIISATTTPENEIIVSTESKNTVLAEHEIEKEVTLNFAKRMDVKKQLTQRKVSSRDSVPVSNLKNKELTDTDYSEDSLPDSGSDSDVSVQPTRMLRKNLKAKSGMKGEAVHDNSIASGKYVELSPGVFLFADKFKFELVEETYRCGLCGYRTMEHTRILRHLRIHNRSMTGRIRRKLIKTAPTKWLYANKYEIETMDGRFVCGLCGFNRKGKYKLIDHIRKVHINNLPLPKYIVEKLTKSDETIMSQSADIPNVDDSKTGENESSANTSSSMNAKNKKKLKMISFLPAKSSRYKEVSPGKWLFDDKFPFEKDGFGFRCSSDGCLDRTFPDLLRVTTHVRKTHCSNTRTRTHMRLREIEPNKFLYGGKYNINLIDGRYTCSVCGFSRKEQRKTCDHIRKIHMLILPASKTRANSDPVSQENVNGSTRQTGESKSNVKERQGPSKYNSMNQEVSPGRWLYHNRYPFEKIDDGFSCGSCSDKFADFRQVLHHVRKFHFKPGLRRKYKMAEVGPDKFLYANEFIVEIVGGRWKCMTCRYNTKGKRKMLGHLRAKHINKAESYVCDTCGKVFTRKDSFRSHIYIHDPARPDLICHVCGKGFKWKRNLTKHLLLHEAKFACDLCEAKFPSESKLKGHRFIHTGEKTFTCNHCPEKFRTHKGLCRHSTYRHGKVLDDFMTDSDEDVKDNIEGQHPLLFSEAEVNTANEVKYDDQYHVEGFVKNDAVQTDELASVVVEEILKLD